MDTGTIHALTPQELDLDATLRSGQVFRWHQAPDQSWSGVVGTRRLRLLASPDKTQLHWQADGPNAEALVRDFLRLDTLSLSTHGPTWAQTDPLFARAWRQQPGVRILRQQPHECFFSFLCASVAPIARIRTMLEGVVQLAGSDLGDGFTAFPSAQQLAQLTETQLRDKGLGFRAARVVSAARELQDAPEGWLEALRGQPLAQLESQLSAFSGIGRKIADCIALFSLDAHDAVPVDTHIWRITRTHYLPGLRDAALTPGTYQQAVDAFQSRFGPYAGWAQQTLFFGQAVGGDRIPPS